MVRNTGIVPYSLATIWGALCFFWRRDLLDTLSREAEFENKGMNKAEAGKQLGYRRQQSLPPVVSPKKKRFLQVNCVSKTWNEGERLFQRGRWTRRKSICPAKEVGQKAMAKEEVDQKAKWGKLVNGSMLMEVCEATLLCKGSGAGWKEAGRQCFVLCG